MNERLVGLLAATPRLLVATDFDGVLAPIVDDPDAVSAKPASLAALRRLATLTGTVVAVVSGRNYDLLERLAAPADGFVLVGSHGAEMGPTVLDDAEAAVMDRLLADLASAASRFPGLHIEAKPLSVAVHFRRMTSDRTEAVADIDELASAWPGKIVSGKEVVEFALRTATKGDAVQRIAAENQVDRTLYLGDDVTDEDVFTVLCPDDIGIKVGDGETSAGYRLPDPAAVRSLLEALAEARASELDRSGPAPSH